MLNKNFLLLKILKIKRYILIFTFILFSINSKINLYIKSIFDANKKYNIENKIINIYGDTLIHNNLEAIGFIKSTGAEIHGDVFINNSTINDYNDTIIGNAISGNVYIFGAASINNPGITISGSSFAKNPGIELNGNIKITNIQENPSASGFKYLTINNDNNFISSIDQGNIFDNLIETTSINSKNGILNINTEGSTKGIFGDTIIGNNSKKIKIIGSNIIPTDFGVIILGKVGINSYGFADTIIGSTTGSGEVLINSFNNDIHLTTNSDSSGNKGNIELNIIGKGDINLSTENKNTFNSGDINIKTNKTNNINVNGGCIKIIGYSTSENEKNGVYIIGSDFKTTDNKIISGINIQSNDNNGENPGEIKIDGIVTINGNSKSINISNNNININSLGSSNTNIGNNINGGDISIQTRTTGSIKIGPGKSSIINDNSMISIGSWNGISSLNESKGTSIYLFGKDLYCNKKQYLIINPDGKISTTGFPPTEYYKKKSKLLANNKEKLILLVINLLKKYKKLINKVLSLENENKNLKNNNQKIIKRIKLFIKKMLKNFYFI
jgi:hypothetical protein